MSTNQTSTYIDIDWIYDTFVTLAQSGFIEFTCHRGGEVFTDIYYDFGSEALIDAVTDSEAMDWYRFSCLLMSFDPHLEDSDLDTWYGEYQELGYDAFKEYLLKNVWTFHLKNIHTCFDEGSQNFSRYRKEGAHGEDRRGYI